MKGRGAGHGAEDGGAPRGTPSSPRAPPAGTASSRGRFLKAVGLGALATAATGGALGAARAAGEPVAEAPRALTAIVHLEGDVAVLSDARGQTVLRTAAADRAINAGIDLAAARGGGLVVVKAGTYSLRGPVRVKSGVHLAGEGRASVLENSTFGEDVHSASVTMGGGTGIANAAISDLSIRIRGQAADGLSVNLATDCLLSNVHIEGDAGEGEDGLHINRSERVIIAHCSIRGAGSPLYQPQIDMSDCKDILLDSCVIDARGNSRGIFLRTSQRITVSQCHFLNTRFEGLYVAQSVPRAGQTVPEDILLTGCQFVGAQAAPGVEVRGGHRVRIEGCSFTQCASGIALTTGDAEHRHSTGDVVVSGSQISGATSGAGILVSGQAPGVGGGRVRNVVLQGNTITRCNGRGIVVTRATDVTISGNVVDGNGLGNLAASGGIAILGTTDDAVENVVVSGNRVTGNSRPGTRTNAAPGISMVRVHGASVDSNLVAASGAHGISLQRVHEFVLNGNLCLDNGVLVASDGIVVTGIASDLSRNGTLLGNRCGNRSAARTQQTGIRLTALVTDLAVHGNHVLHNAAAGLSIDPKARASLRDNVGHATEASGTLVFPAGQTRVEVTHELASAPKVVLVTAGGLPPVGAFRVVDKKAGGGTRFVVATDLAPEGSVVLDWVARL